MTLTLVLAGWSMVSCIFYGLQLECLMLRPIPPVQKLSVLVPETQAPAPKGHVSASHGDGGHHPVVR